MSTLKIILDSIDEDFIRVINSVVELEKYFPTGKKHLRVSKILKEIRDLKREAIKKAKKNHVELPPY